ncbi:nucleotidyltransferase domain-containing protein [Microlunatus sp. GCM10028923]|uniref:nucleotidyltransferase domain-containing protein n=1 Tax=Microlunatus sp. GCM10028923 TaxID=3273400 RepID=UPI003612AC99
MIIEDPVEDEVHRLYGPSAGRTPADAAALMAGYPGRWWIAGGWAVEAQGGAPRVHGDLDLSVPRADLALLRRHLAGRLDVWIADRGSLTPLLPDEDPDEPPERLLPDECENLWTRASGADPWEYDVILMDGDEDGWIFKRDSSIRLPWPEIIRTVDGLDYLRAELQLLHKAARRRPKDQYDFEAVLPALDPDARRWLHDVLARVHPGHLWLAELQG